jgi:DNA-binding transcriptional regulator GbsR (MarR family)
MTELEFIKWFFLGSIGVVMWFLRQTATRAQTDIDMLKADIIKIKSEYLHRDDFREFKQELRAMFDEIKQDIKDLKHHE